MKNLVLILGFGCMAGSVAAQEIRDAKNNVTNYIDIHATALLDKNKNVICTFKQDGRIVDPKANTLGFIVNGYEIQNKEHKVLGYFVTGGQLQDANHAPFGRVSMDGTGPVMDSKNNVIGFIDKVEPMWAAAYFLMLKSL